MKGGSTLPIDPRLRSPQVDRLFEAVLKLENVDECYRLFSDLCTVGEIQAMAQRLQVAELLDRGATYDEVVKETGMSTATVSRVKKFLLWGADGYRLVLDRFKDG